MLRENKQPDTHTHTQTLHFSLMSLIQMLTKSHLSYFYEINVKLEHKVDVWLTSDFLLLLLKLQGAR